MARERPARDYPPYTPGRPPTQGWTRSRPTVFHVPNRKRRPKRRISDDAPSIERGETAPDGHVLRAGLRALVVALDPVRPRPFSPAHRGLRAFPRGARRAGYHPGQDRGGGVGAPDGAVARRAEMVRGGPLAPCGDLTYRSSVQCPVGRPGSLVGRVGRLDESLVDVLPPATHPRHRRHLGGARLERLRLAATANRPLGALGEPDPWCALGFLALAADGGRGGPLLGHCVRHRMDGCLHLGL